MTERYEATQPIDIVSVGVVAYNEEQYLLCLLEDIASQDFPHNKIELILIDGASSDGTKQIMKDFSVSAVASDFFRVVLLDNPKKILPAGCNVMLENFTGDCIVRIDAHARLPKDFISQNVAVLDEGEYVSAGPRPTIAEPKTAASTMLLMAEDSAFGSSVADYRFSSKKEYVSSAFHAMFRRCAVEAVGLYNEALSRTEDNDYFYRLGKEGYRIRFDGRIQSKQIARSTYKRMMKQKYGNGFWIGRTMYVQPKCFKIYHFAPFAFVIGIALLALIGLLASWIPFVIAGILYALCCVLLSVKAIIEKKVFSAYQLLLPFVFVSIHVVYGVGTVAGLVSGFINKLTHNKG